MAPTESRLELRHTGVEAINFAGIDLIIAASGYEPRSKFILERLTEKWKLDRREIGRKLLLAEFDDLRELPGRIASDAFFANYAPKWRVEANKDDSFPVRTYILSALKHLPTGAVNVLVDYSSMPRMWYLPLLSLQRSHPDLRITFCYSLGDYGAAGPEYPVSAVGDIRTVPGLEGVGQTRPRFHVFGLGYDGKGTLALARQLEIENYATFWAEPGSSSQAPRIAMERNKELVRRAKLRFRGDLRDVAGLVDLLRRIAHETQLTHKVVLVPVGPKPHVLACGIVAAESPHVSIIAPHFSGGGIRRDHPEVRATGEVICCSVQRRARRREDREIPTLTL